MRLRITFSKSGALRYIGHLDLHSLWERTARRAGLPLAYTQGFHPGPKIQLASALPLGFIGRAEIVDMWINEGDDSLDRPHKAQQPVPHEIRNEIQKAGHPCKNQDYLEILQSAAPPGLAITSVEVVDEHSPALQTQVISAEYEVTLPRPALDEFRDDIRDSELYAVTGITSQESVSEPGLVKAISALLGTTSLMRERRGKAYDLRPLITSLSLSHSPKGEGEGARVLMTLSAREGATGRPEEVLAVLGVPFETARIERTALILK